MYYNRDFYCVQIHDAEVACDGLLFNNIFEMPMTTLPDKEVLFIEGIFNQIQEEMRSQYSLTYSPTNKERDGSFRKIEVKTANKDLKVQVRKGYFATRGTSN